MYTLTDIAAPGRLDGAGAETLSHQLDEAIRAGRYRIRISLRATAFLSSAGIRALLIYRRQLEQLGGSLAVAEASAMSRATLDLSGLASLMDASLPPAASASATPAAPRRAHANQLNLEIETLDAGKLTGVRIGRPELPARPSADNAPLTRLTLAEDFYGVGLGAFGPPDECRSRIGELICAAGTAVTRAADCKVPDYMISQPRLAPEIHVLYAAGFQGRFAALARFRPDADAADAPLAALLQTLLSANSWPAMGFAIVAEISGLVGAAIIRAPSAAGSGGDFFDFPALRERLEYTAEPEYGRDLAVAVGVAFRDAPSGAWQPFVRPDGADNFFAHIHAAVFAYRALPAGAPDFAAVFRELLEKSQVRAVLHLIHDRRPAAGLGDSRFRHGMVWCGPLI